MTADEFIPIADINARKLVYTPDALGFGAPYDFLYFQVQDDGGTANGGVDTDPLPRTMTIDVNQIVHQPLFTAGVADASYYFVGGAAALLAPNLVVADALYPQLSQATVAISAGLAAGDQLTLNGETTGTVNAIAFNYDSATGVLTLSGQDTIANYQAALRLVAYSSTSPSPPADSASARAFSLTATSADPAAAEAMIANGPTLTLADNVAYFLAHQAALDALGHFTITDTWANVLAGLDGLNDDGAVAAIKLIDASPPVTTITAAQAQRDTRALGLLSAPWPLSISVHDTAAALAGLASAPLSNLTSLKAAGVASLLATDAAPILNVVQTSHLESAGLSLASAVAGALPVLSDTAAALRAFLNPQTLAGLAALSIRKIIATTNMAIPVALTDALINASVYIIATAGHTVVYNYDDGSKTSLTFDDSGVSTVIRSYDTSGHLLNVQYNDVIGAQYTSYQVQYGANGKPASAFYSNDMVATWTYNPDGSLHDVAFDNVTGAPFTSYDVIYGANGKPASASYSNGVVATWTYNPDNSLHDVAYANLTGAPYTSYDVVYDANRKPASAFFSNGMVATWTYNPDNSLHDVAYADVTGAQYRSFDVVYGANHKPASASYSNGMVVTWTYNPDDSLHDVAYADVTGAQYTSFDVVYGANGKPASASFSNGMVATWTYNPDDSLHDVAYAKVTGAQYTSYDVVYGANGRPLSAGYSNGMVATWTYSADGEVLTAFANVPNAPYCAYDNIFGVTNNLLARVFDYLDGSGLIRLPGDALTVEKGGSSLEIATAGATWSLTPHAIKSIDARGSSDETFVLHSSFGQTSINGFDASLDHVAFDPSAIGSLAQLLAQASATGAGGHNLTIASGDDRLTLLGVLNGQSATDDLTASSYAFGVYTLPSRRWPTRRP